MMNNKRYLFIINIYFIKSIKILVTRISQDTFWYEYANHFLNEFNSSTIMIVIDSCTISYFCIMNLSFQKRFFKKM